VNAASRQRFLDRVELQPDGCHLWTGSLSTSGYGQVTIDLRNLLAHRVAYEMTHGAVPTGLQLDHLCRNRACVNPAHLEPVSSRTNTLRGTSPPAVNARKTRCIHGHELAGENLYVGADGRRICRTCSREKQRRHRRRLTQGAAP
jgi:hypothetical protein